MFKRVEKKLARRRKEEELGITEEIKEAIGLNDVDSDDSSSDESEASSSSSSPKISLKRKRLLDDDELDSSPDADSDVQGSDDLGDPEDGEDEPGVQMTVEVALHDPLYIVSIQPDIKGCIVCPRKLLKNDTMVSVHIRSQAHQRRISKFREVATSAKPDDDAQDILSIVFASAPLRPKPSSNDPAPLSKRAAKRIAKLEKVKTKRQKHKAAKARSIAARAAKKLESEAGSESETNDVVRTVEPPKKKPKLDLPSPPKKPVKPHPPATKLKSDAIIPKEARSKRQHAALKESQATDAKTNPKSQPVEKRKKRKERS